MMKSDRSQTSKGNFWKSDFLRSLTSNFSLAPLTTFQIGGPARYFIETRTIKEVVEAVTFARERALKIFILGGGSNIVIADSGFDGLVIAMRIHDISSEKRDGRNFVTVGSGVVWDDFVLWSIENGLTGLECMSGVPGTVGGAVVANLGCYGAQVSDTFISAEVIDTQEKNLNIKTVEKDECDFSYHHSSFGRANGRYIIINATFSLLEVPISMPSYRDNRFDMTALANKIGRDPTQTDIRNAILKIREEKGSLIMKNRFSLKSAGSFFHMPFVPKEQYEIIESRAGALDSGKAEGLRPWAWKQPNGTYKIAPGFLLEFTEFQKGYIRGEVGISPRHTLVIINIGNTSARDISILALDMQKAVEKIFDVKLEREVEYIGDVEK